MVAPTANREGTQPQGKASKSRPARGKRRLSDSWCKCEGRPFGLRMKIRLAVSRSGGQHRLVIASRVVVATERVPPLRTSQGAGPVVHGCRRDRGKRGPLTRLRTHPC